MGERGIFAKPRSLEAPTDRPARSVPCVVGRRTICDEDGRRPGPFLARCETVVAIRSLAAGVQRRATTVGVARTALRVRTDRQSGRLDRTGVVERVPLRRLEFVVGEANDTSLEVTLAGDHLPGVFDERGEWFVCSQLGSDADDLDARDRSS